MKLEFNTELVREKLLQAEAFESSSIARLKQNVLNLKLIAILIKFDIAEAGKFLFIIQDLKLPLSISKSFDRNLKHLFRVQNIPHFLERRYRNLSNEPFLILCSILSPQTSEVGIMQTPRMLGNLLFLSRCQLES